MNQLAGAFALEIDAYAIMSNHFHLVVYYDPTANRTWSNEEVARRWVEAFPPKVKGVPIDDAKNLLRSLIIADPIRTAGCRERLGSLSAFMQHLKQPIAWRANQEDGCSGHFFEQRFYSGALLNEHAVIATMAYVDLNPVRAKIAQSVEECQYTSIHKRLEHLENTPERLDQALDPLTSGLSDVEEQTSEAASNSRRHFALSLRTYLERLRDLIRADSERPTTSTRTTFDRAALWIAQVAAIRRHQRAHGSASELARWIQQRGMRPLETPIPS